MKMSKKQTNQNKIKQNSSRKVSTMLPQQSANHPFDQLAIDERSIVRCPKIIMATKKLLIFFSPI